MPHCTYISLYAAVESHRLEFENSIKEALLNALRDLDPNDIRIAFSPSASERSDLTLAA